MLLNLVIINKDNFLKLSLFLYLIISERNTGVEPASQAWEARALPMC